MPEFFEVLRHRKVYRTIAIYVATCFAVLQGLDLILPALDLPTSWLTWAVLASIVGFPFVVAAAWIFDLRTDSRDSHLQRLFAFAAAIAASGVAGFLLWPTGPETAVPLPSGPEVVAVSDFAGRGHASAVEDFGPMLSDVLRSGVLQLGAVRVLHRDADARAHRDVQVEGSYFVEGRGVSVTARIVDPDTDQVLDALQPIEGHADSLSALADAVRDRILTALLRRLDDDVGPFPAEPGHVPPLGAYQAYAEGDRHFVRGEYGRAIELFNSAIEIDPRFMLPRMRTASAYSNAANYVAADSVLRSLEPWASVMLPHEAAYARMVGAWLDGDHTSAYEASSLIASLTPGSRVEYDVGNALRHLNRPRAAIDVLSSLDPDSDVWVGFAAFWNSRADAHHMVEDFDVELAVAHDGLSRDPDRSSILLREVRALAAMGDTARLNTALARAESLPSSPSGRSNPGTHYRVAGEELRAHGHAGWRDYFLRSEEWYLRQPDAGPSSEVFRGLLRLRNEMGDWEEAAALLGSTPVEDDDVELRGFRALLATRLGDEESAAAYEQSLLDWEEPYIRGYHLHWAARVAAADQRHDDAIARLNRGFSEGQRHGRLDSWGTGMSLHSLHDFEGLRGLPAFEVLSRPSG